MPNDEQQVIQKDIQEIYKALLNLTADTSRGLQNMQKVLHQLEKQLLEVYKKNDVILRENFRHDLTSPVNRVVDNAKKMAAALDQIHEQNIQMNAELHKVGSMLSLLHGNDNPVLKSRIDVLLQKATAINAYHKELLVTLQKQMFVLGDGKEAPRVIGEKEMKAIDVQLQGLFNKAQALKEELKDFKNAAQKASNDISQSSVFSKRPGAK